MKELQLNEVQEVSGGFYSVSNLAAATRFTGALGFLSGAFQVGFTAGTWLNENTPIQMWISEVIEAN